NEGTIMSSLARRIERLEQTAVDLADLVRELGAAEGLSPEEIEQATACAREDQERIRATPGWASLPWGPDHPVIVEDAAERGEDPRAVWAEIQATGAGLRRHHQYRPRYVGADYPVD